MDQPVLDHTPIPAVRVTAWKPLPSLKPPRQSEESAYSYGYRVLLFLMDTGVTATISTDDLELAAHVSVYATTPHDINAKVLVRISDIRHLIETTVQARKDRPIVPAASIPGLKPEKPNLGPMARLPEPIGVRPSPGQLVKVDIEF